MGIRSAGSFRFFTVATRESFLKLFTHLFLLSFIWEVTLLDVKQHCLEAGAFELEG